MKTVWGLLLIGCCFFNGQAALAGKWVPCLGIGISHSQMLIQSDYSYPDESNSNVIDKNLGSADFQVSAGVRGNRFGFVFRFYHSEFSDVWAKRTQIDSEFRRNSVFSEWRDDRALFGLQYFVTRNPENPLRIYGEGGLGFGTAWYHEDYTYCRNSSDICHPEDYDAQTPSFFLQYAGIGAALDFGNRLGLELNYLIQHAHVSLDGNQWYGAIDAQTENWTSAFQLSALIKIAN